MYVYCFSNVEDVFQRYHKVIWQVEKVFGTERLEILHSWRFERNQWASSKLRALFCNGWKSTNQTAETIETETKSTKNAFEKMS